MSRIRTTEETRSHWNSFANSYERYFLKTTLQINTLLIPLLNLFPSDTIVECGCGTGSGIEILHDYCPTLTKILANDISEEILQIARAKNLPNTEFFLANNESLPYDSESCDRYVSNLSLQIVENPEKMVQEAFRVLKRGGTAVFSVWGKAAENNLFVVFNRAGRIAGIEPSTERSHFHLNEEGKLGKLLTDAGFVMVRSIFTCVPVLVRTVEEVLEMSDSRVETQALKAANPELYQRLNEALREEASKIFASGNFLTFDTLIAVGQKR